MMRADRPISGTLAQADDPRVRPDAAAGQLQPIEMLSRESPGQDGRFIDDAGLPGFRSILFPPGLEEGRAETNEQPPCFVDLNLDQVVAAIVAKRDEDVLRPLFYSPYRSEEIIRHRQAVFADLERAEVFQPFPHFCETMRTVRAKSAYADKISCKCHRHMVILRAIHLYCEGVLSLLQSLNDLTLRSAGLQNLRRYLTGYAASDSFSGLAADAGRLRDVLSKISYGTLFRGDRVTVREIRLRARLYHHCP